MELTRPLFDGPLLWWVDAFYIGVILVAFWMAPWRRRVMGERFQVFLGATVVLTLLWHVRAPVTGELSFHLLGVTAVNLMFGWSLTVISTALALLGVTLNGRADAGMFAVNALMVSVLPATLSQMALVLIRSVLPKNFFIYVLGSGFVTSGVVGLASGYLAVGILLLGGALTYPELAERFIPYFPLMFLPEALINGWAATILVAFRPEWLYSFSDELYIKGK